MTPNDHDTPSLPLPSDLVDKMRATPQNPNYHQEGDVLAHTLLVLKQFHELIGQFELTKEEEQALYWAVLLHDSGKTESTKMEEGRWRSPGHEKISLAIGRKILNQQKDLSFQTKRLALDLIRWHGFSLRWSNSNCSLNDLKILGSRADLKLLGIFSIMDFKGRISQDQDTTMNKIIEFHELHVPRAEYELGSYSHLQKLYTEWSIKKKNAAWNAVRMSNSDLLEKIIQSPQEENPEQIFRKAIVPVGYSPDRETLPLPQGFSEVFQVHLRDHSVDSLAAMDSFTTNRRLVEFKYYLTSYFRNNPFILLKDWNTKESLRLKINSILRDAGVQIYHLYPTVDDVLDNSSELLNDFEIPHPWEAHFSEWK